MARLILTIVLITLASCGEKHVKSLNFKTISGVKPVKVMIGNETSYVPFFGTVISNKTIMVNPKVIGYLKSTRAKVGETVRKGQTLAVIDSSDIMPDVKRAKAGLSEINSALKEVNEALNEVKANKAAVLAKYKLASITYKRFKKLLDADAVSKQRFDEVRTRYEASRDMVKAVNAKEAQVVQKRNELLAKKRQVEAGLSKAKAFLSYTVLKSPVDGVILKRMVDVGNLVSPRVSVYEIGSYPLKVLAFVDAEFRDRIRLGETLKVSIDGKLYSGRVCEMNRSADPVSHKFGVKLLINGKEAMPGTYAQVLIPTRSSSYILVPKSTIYNFGSLSYVFVIRNGTAHLCLVKTGKSKGNLVSIVSGLHDNDTIASSNVGKLFDGARVE